MVLEPVQRIFPDVDLEETLGHSSITITGDTYTSVLLELERHSTEAASKLIPRKRRRPAA